MGRQRDLTVALEPFVFVMFCFPAACEWVSGPSADQCDGRPGTQDGFDLAEILVLEPGT
jgi:hypothetical protein